MEVIVPIIVKAVVTAAISTAVGYAVGALSGSNRMGIGPNVTAPDRSYGLGDKNEEIRPGPLSVSADPGGSQIGIFGRRRVGGRVILSAQSDEDDKNYLVIAIAGAPVDAIEAVFMENQRVLLDEDGFVTTPPWVDGSVNIALYDGTQTEADEVLKVAFPGWTDEYVGKLVAYARIQIDQGEAPTAFETGTPDFTFMVRGFRCYDPRDETQEISDRETWVYSDNATIVNANYLVHELGAGLDPSFVDWDSVAEAAEIDDEPVSLLSGGTEPRYSCAIRWLTDERHEDVLARIGYSHAGGMYLVGKSYRAYTGAFKQSTASITPSDYAVGGISWSDTPPISALYNGVRGTFSSPLHNHEPRDFPSYQDAAALAADGRECWLDLDLSAVTSPYQAQRLARIAYGKARHGFPASVALQFTHFDIVSDDIISISDPLAGFDLESFRVLSDRLDDGFVVSLGLEREAAEFYAWNPETDERPFDPVESIYGSAAGGNLQSTGSSEGDTGDVVAGGGSFVDANSGGSSFRPRCYIWQSPNIAPDAFYRFRVSYRYDRVVRTGISSSSGEVSRSTETETVSYTGAGSSILGGARTQGYQTTLGLGTYLHYENVRVTGASLRTERAGSTTSYVTLFNGTSHISNFDGLTESTSPYFAMPTPCAPYALSFEGGEVEFKTNFLSSSRADTVEFYDFPDPVSLQDPVFIGSVSNSGEGAQTTYTKPGGQFAYVRARSKNTATGKVSPWSNWLLVIF